MDAGTYTNDDASISKNITLQGVGGTVELVSNGSIPNGKAIFIVNGYATIYTFEFSGAQVADNNREGIRFESGNHALNDCYFHDNQEAMPAGSSGTLTINNGEFAYNGIGDDQTHDFYAGKLADLTIDNSYFDDAKAGIEVKSRALNPTITNLRLCDLSSTASLSIDLSNGGNATLENNVIQQGPNSPSSKLIDYGQEDNFNPGTNFVINGDTIFNDLFGSPSLLAAWNATTTATAQPTNNKFFGLTASRIASGPNTRSGNQFLTTEPALDMTSPWLAQMPLSIGAAPDTGSYPADNITSNPDLEPSRQGHRAGQYGGHDHGGRRHARHDHRRWQAHANRRRDRPRRQHRLGVAELHA